MVTVQSVVESSRNQRCTSCGRLGHNSRSRKCKAATSDAAARRYYRALRLVGTPPAAARAQVHAAIVEGVQLAETIRAGARS